MAAEVGLEHLPIDAVECIADYLSPSDLSHCCATSHTWRKVFDNDTFWKKRFNKIIADYLKVAKCKIEPTFRLESAALPPVNSYKGNCLREACLWKNWRSGRFKREEIEFDCDDRISYNIKVEFLNNDLVLLHRTFQTEVWDVTQEPNLVLEIPFNLNDMWEDNLYKVVEGRLVVVQCNVVQVFNMCLESKTSNLHYVFFFDKSEEFSSSKLKDAKDIDKVFQETSYDNSNHFERVICGIFLVGIVTKDLKTPVIHVWNIKTGKKVKENVCPVLQAVPSDINLKACEKSHDKVIVIFDVVTLNRGSYYTFLYDLEKLHFVESSKVLTSGEFTLFDKYLCALTFSSLTLFDYDFERNSTFKSENEPIILKKFPFKNTGCLRTLQNKLLVSHNKEIASINPAKAQLKGEVKPILQVDFTFSDFQVVHDRFLAFHDMECSLKEIWEVQEAARKVLSLPEDSGSYCAVNEACTRIVLERGNKLIILSFW